MPNQGCGETGSTVRRESGKAVTAPATVSGLDPIPRHCALAWEGIRDMPGSIMAIHESGDRPARLFQSMSGFTGVGPT